MLQLLPLPGNRVAFFMLVALVVSALLARILTPVANRIGLADPPGGRKKHVGTIPVTGGIAMFAAFFIAATASGLMVGTTVALLVALSLLVLWVDD
jgi:UDP-GlcNAc:undecaprenyl-phosphate GlcNAc-1-phosphate transferase